MSLSSSQRSSYLSAFPRNSIQSNMSAHSSEGRPGPKLRLGPEQQLLNDCINMESTLENTSRDSVMSDFSPWNVAVDDRSFGGRCNLVLCVIVAQVLIYLYRWGEDSIRGAILAAIIAAARNDAKLDFSRFGLFF